MFRFQQKLLKTPNSIRKFTICLPRNAEGSANINQRGESERMKQFHEKLKLEKIPRVEPGMRFIDLVLVDTNPSDGELVSNSERNPTKYGDWQHNGRVTDF